MIIRFRLTFDNVASGAAITLYFKSKEEAEQAVLIRKKKSPHLYDNFKIVPVLLK